MRSSLSTHPLIQWSSYEHRKINRRELAAFLMMFDGFKWIARCVISRTQRTHPNKSIHLFFLFLSPCAALLIFRFSRRTCWSLTPYSLSRSDFEKEFSFFFYFRYHAIDLTPASSPAPSWCQRPAVLVKKDESFRKEKNSGSHTLSFCSNVVIRWNQTIVLMAQSHSVSCDMNCVQIVVVFFQPRSWICLLVHGRHSTVRGESFACALYGDRIEMSELSWTSKGINGWEQTVRSSIIATGV